MSCSERLISLLQELVGVLKEDVLPSWWFPAICGVFGLVGGFAFLLLDRFSAEQPSMETRTLRHVLGLLLKFGCIVDCSTFLACCGCWRRCGRHLYRHLAEGHVRHTVSTLQQRGAMTFVSFLAFHQAF